MIRSLHYLFYRLYDRTWSVKFYQIDKLILSINFNRLVLVKTKEILLKMEIKIEIPQDIISDKKRLNSVQQGILKAISRGPYEEGLAFNIVNATFDW